MVHLEVHHLVFDLVVFFYLLEIKDIVLAHLKLLKITRDKENIFIEVKFIDRGLVTDH